MLRFTFFLALTLSSLALNLAKAQQRLEWREEPIEQTQTLSFDLNFGEEVTVITRIRGADLQVRALATYSQALVDGTVMAAILRTQPLVRFANSGGAFVSWQTDVRQFQKLGVIEEDDFAITITMPAVEGADFTPNLKIELVMQPVTPDSDLTFLETADLSDDVPGAADYGLAALQDQTLYPDIDMSALVSLRTVPDVRPSIARRGGRCAGVGEIRTMFARLTDLTPEGLGNQAAFPQECWGAIPDGLSAGDIAGNEAYQPDIRVRLGENSGDLIGFVYGAGTEGVQRIFLQNTSGGWFYGSGDGEWAVVRNGTRVDAPFGNGILAIRNPRGGETKDATENDAFVSYLVE